MAVGRAYANPQKYVGRKRGAKGKGKLNPQKIRFINQQMLIRAAEVRACQEIEDDGQGRKFGSNDSRTRRHRLPSQTDHGSDLRLNLLRKKHVFQMRMLHAVYLEFRVPSGICG